MQRNDLPHVVSIIAHGALALIFVLVYSIWRGAEVAVLLAALAACSAYVFQVTQYLLDDPLELELELDRGVGLVLTFLFAVPLLLAVASIVLATMGI